jgi:hypothetical protein
LAKVVVDKAMSSVKANIKSLGSAVLLELFATKTPGSFEEFYEGIAEQLGNRNVKTQAAGVQALI